MIKLQITADEKAKLKAFVYREDKPKSEKQPKPITYTIKTKADFAAFCKQDSSAAKLFGNVFTWWRRSKMPVSGDPGYYAAYTHLEWLTKTGVKAVSTLKHQLDRLEEAGLIERSRHRQGGSRVVSFIRPTPLALEVTTGSASDWQHLGLSAPNKTKDAKPFEALHAIYKVAYEAQVGAPLAVMPKNEAAALRQIMKAVPNAGELIDFVVREWGELAFYVMTKTKVSPTKTPSAMSLNKNIQLATEFMQFKKAELAKLAEKLAANEAAKKSITAQPETLVPPSPTAKEVTLEDILGDDF